MPSKKKKYNARFPPARIKKIMQTDEDVGKVAAAVPVIISRALELFIESLIVKASENTYARNAKTLSTAHIKQTIQSEKKFDFLKDLVANVPDIQGEEEAETSTNSDGATRPRGRPRKKRKENDGPSKRKDRKVSSDESYGEGNSEAEDQDDEETDTEEEGVTLPNDEPGMHGQVTPLAPSTSHMPEMRAAVPKMEQGAVTAECNSFMAQRPVLGSENAQSVSQPAYTHAHLMQPQHAAVPRPMMPPMPTMSGVNYLPPHMPVPPSGQSLQPTSSLPGFYQSSVTEDEDDDYDS